MLTKAHSFFLNQTGGLKLSHSHLHYKQASLFSARANKWDLTPMRTGGSREQVDFHGAEEGGGGGVIIQLGQLLRESPLML